MKVCLSKDEIFGLVCSGGGAPGAYQVGVLKYLVEEVIQEHSSPFKVILVSHVVQLTLHLWELML